MNETNFGEDKPSPEMAHVMAEAEDPLRAEKAEKIRIATEVGIDKVSIEQLAGEMDEKTIEAARKREEEYQLATNLGMDLIRGALFSKNGQERVFVQEAEVAPLPGEPPRQQPEGISSGITWY